ncbi:MAG TPA: diguanylate cyclase [Actinomycetota bacterium]|nr:diguanylate cyclase [Actinomycetota bacterium]
MSLQRRLTLFFVLIVILPLAAAGYVVQRVVVGEMSRRAVLALDPALDAAVAVYNARVRDMADDVRRTVEQPRLGELIDKGRPGKVKDFLVDALDRAGELDFIVLLDDEGRVLGHARGPGDFVDGFERPDPGEIVGGGEVTGPGFTRTQEIPVRVQGQGEVGSVVGGFWLDRSVLIGATAGTVELSMVAGGTIIASTADLDGPARIGSFGPATFEADIGGAASAKGRLLDGSDLALVSSTAEAPIRAVSDKVILYMAALLLLALGAVTGLAYVLARLITQPLEELSAGAAAIAEGRFDHRIQVRSRDEVGQLAEAFNDMTDTLGETVSELSSSRDQLRRAIRRVGDTLRSTHDMKQMLSSVLNTTVDAIRADGAVLWMFGSTREELYPARGVNVDLDALGRVKVGEGVVGLVAERSVNVMLPQQAGPRPTPAETLYPVTIAIPLYSQDRIMGVIAVHRNDPADHFTEEEFDYVVFLGEQAGVAVENVLLHEEAQRLSITDGLTGVWNRRYFLMQFPQALAAAQRFQRPFSVLMLDLDSFKAINDTHGHQRGDAILVEFSKRVTRVIREVDTFARYGGEEFICLLSETDLHGARTTAEKVLDAIRSEPFGSPGEQPLTITVSIGVASYPMHGDTYKALVAASDKALYRAKQEGRDRVCTADEPEPPLKLAT